MQWKLGGVILDIWSWWSVVVTQFEFGFVSAALPQFRSLVEGLLWIGKADKSNFPQANATPVMARFVHTGPQQDGPFHCWREATVAYFPDVTCEGGLRPLGGIELLDCLGFDDPVFIGEGVVLG